MSVSGLFPIAKDSENFGLFGLEILTKNFLIKRKECGQKRAAE